MIEYEPEFSKITISISSKNGDWSIWNHYKVIREMIFRAIIVMKMRMIIAVMSCFIMIRTHTSSNSITGEIFLMIFTGSSIIKKKVAWWWWWWNERMMYDSVPEFEITHYRLRDHRLWILFVHTRFDTDGVGRERDHKSDHNWKAGWRMRWEEQSSITSRNHPTHDGRSFFSSTPMSWFY